MAQDRVEWKSVVAKVTCVFCELRGEKITKRREARNAKEALHAKRVKIGAFWSVCLNVGSCLGVLACTAWRALSCLVLCLLETISCSRSANSPGEL